MSLSHAEIADIKSDLKVVKNSMVNMSNAQTENTKAQTEVAKQISGLLIEMKERDVRNEFLTTEVKQITHRQIGFEDFARPILIKSKEKQDFKQKITDSMGTNTGRLIIVVFVTGALLILGVDPTKWKF